MQNRKVIFLLFLQFFEVIINSLRKVRFFFLDILFQHWVKEHQEIVGSNFISPSYKRVTNNKQEAPQLEPLINIAHIYNTDTSKTLNEVNKIWRANTDI